MTDIETLLTPERVTQGGILQRGKPQKAPAVCTTEHLIDALLEAGQIDSMQHNYGVQIITLRIIRMGFLQNTENPAYDDTLRGRPLDRSPDDYDTTDLYDRVIQRLQPWVYAVIKQVCFDNRPHINAAGALTELGDMLYQVRRELELKDE